MNENEPWPWHCDNVKTVARNTGLQISRPRSKGIEANIETYSTDNIISFTFSLLLQIRITMLSVSWAKVKVTRINVSDFFILLKRQRRKNMRSS